MKNLLRVGLGALVVFSWLGGCSDDKGSIVGETVDTKTVTIGLTTQEVVLGTPTRGATVVFPMGVTRAMTTVQVNLNDKVRKKGAAVAGTVVEVATMAVMFEMPARMRQALPPPPPGRSYVAVSAAKQGDTWAVNRGGVRAVGAGSVSAPPVPGGQADAGAGDVDIAVDGGVESRVQPQPTQALETAMYEADITGTGYWAIALEVVTASAGGGSGTCAQVVTKFQGCGFSFKPAGVNPCTDVNAQEDACTLGCFAKANCSELTGLFCSSAIPGTNSAVFQCMLQCEGALGETPIACGANETYTSFDRCDGFPDCSDGADELGCPTFACGDGTTTVEGNRCDGAPDCANGADEAGCPPETDLFCPNGMEANFGSDESFDDGSEGDISI